MGRRIFQLSVPIFLVLACDTHHDRMEGNSAEETFLEPTFQNVQALILQPKCVSCHHPDGKFVDLSTHAAVMASKQIVPGDPLSSRLYESVMRGRMPKGLPPLRANEIQLLFDWISKGALSAEEETPPPVEPPPVLPPVGPPQANYEWIRQNIIDTRCVKCHDGKHPKNRLDMRSYENLMDYSGEIFRAIEPGDPEFSLFFRSIANGTMPSEGAPRLTEEECQAVKDWILAGASKSPPLLKGTLNLNKENL